MERVLMVMGEADIGIRTASIPFIIQVSLVDNWFLLVMVMTVVDKSIRPSNLILITTAEYTLTTQGSLKNIIKGV